MRSVLIAFVTEVMTMVLMQSMLIMIRELSQLFNQSLILVEMDQLGEAK